jgi:putative CocE/NonD family hydrolase
MRRISALLVTLLFALWPLIRISAQPADPARDFGHGIEPSRREITTQFDFIRREEMIPMRDGVRLYTIILIPVRQEKMPIVLTRTPYGASVRSAPEQRARLEDVLTGGDDIFAGSGYIRVFQDVRGRNRSGGKYVVTLPLRGPLNRTPVDHSTDTYDTIEWLLNNVEQNNGRVGMIGVSYDGLLVLMGLVDPHPALKAAVPINPMVDGWKGDDWFHNGAFRQMALDFLKLHLLPSQAPDRSRAEDDDDYVFFLDEVSAEEAARRIGIEKLDFWQKLTQHPSYDSFWKDQAMDKILAGRPLKVPTMYVHSLWDQEDIYGAIAAYSATESKDTNNDANYLVVGPWNHGGASGSSLNLGPLVFKDATGKWFRRNILLPFLDQRLKPNAPEADTPPVLVYESGADTWQSYDAWPLSCESGCRYPMRPLYLEGGLGLGFDRPAADEGAYDAYVSNPANPIPYRKRPIMPVYSRASSWNLWLLDDQGMFSRRKDVLTYRTAVLDDPVALGGLPVANLFAATSGTDVDFVVKLIDEYPDPYPQRSSLAGYQLIISADILRGRYRRDPSSPSPVTPGAIGQYRWTLPATSHVFLPGHRIMVQIQSSWFPLYDRNPQKFVKNIFFALPDDYGTAEQKIYRSGEYASYIELPLIQ